MNLDRNENYIQATKFLIFSISAGVIQALSFTFLYEIIKFEYWPSYLVALTLSVLWNFTLNRRFTFKSAANIPLAMTKVAIFYVIFTPLSTIWGDALTKSGWNAYLVLGLTMVTNLVTEFIYTKYYVYKNNINTAINKSIET